jgi:hypothetical protein
MAAFTKFHCLPEHLAEKVHNLGSDTLKVVLTDVAPVAATNTVLTDITDLATGGGYTAGGSAVTVTSSAQSGGVYSLAGNDLVFTASGGTIGPFSYAVLYNDTATNDELIGYWPYGSSITLADGETFTLNFGASILTLT